MSEPSLPQRLVIMGVSGSGKSTLSLALGERLGLQVMDGDEHTVGVENLTAISPVKR
jgi:adenylate kinase family enzyme